MLLALLFTGCDKPEKPAHDCFDEKKRKDVPEKVSIPATVHFYDGTGEDADETMLEINKLLKRDFRPVGIRFSDVAFDMRPEPCTGEYQQFVRAATSEPERLDIFICPGIFYPFDYRTLTGVAGNSVIAGGRASVSNNEISPSNHTVSHEIAHAFGLYHTFNDVFGTELADGSNCQTAGDFICDTPADPGNCDVNFAADPTALVCGTELGTMKRYEPLTNNLMNYTRDYMMEPPRFTAEQGEVMRCVIGEKRYGW